MQNSTMNSFCCVILVPTTGTPTTTTGAPVTKTKAPETAGKRLAQEVEFTGV